MAGPTRRDVLATSALGVIAAPALAAADPAAQESTARDLDRYVGFGVKASGGPGDTLCGGWLEAALVAAGFRTARQSLDVPWFDARRAEIVVGDQGVAVTPHAIVVPTGAAGVGGRLVRIDPVVGVQGSLAGAIALIDLPYARWSSALARPVHDTVAAAVAAGAVAAVLVTNGPTGDAIALNADGRAPIVDRPVVILSPKRAKPVLLAAGVGGSAVLHVSGDGGRRAAFNLIGRIDRGRDRWIIVSTPRSGWFTCAGERGPGIAAWLALARWAATADIGHNLAFLCTSGHEYEYLGAEQAMGVLPPPPEKTALWLHLGANVAARDWQELGGGLLLPLPSADPQRFVVASADLVPGARQAFAGLPGLEMAYPVTQGAAGELAGILAAGYPRALGIFGGHRFHHSAQDDARCVSAALVEPVVAACRAMIAKA